MELSPGRDTDRKFEALEREIDALFSAAERRCARFAAAAARELGLDRLADQFLAEAGQTRDEGGADG